FRTCIARRPPPPSTPFPMCPGCSSAAACPPPRCRGSCSTCTGSRRSPVRRSARAARDICDFRSRRRPNCLPPRWTGSPRARSTCHPPINSAEEIIMSTGKVTIATLNALKTQGRKAVFISAYDYPTATFADRAGVDMLLVGDSAAMTMLGLPSTLGIGLEEMLVFARAVSRAAQHAFVIGDMPFLSYQPSDECAVRSAGAFVGSAGCDAVKCEGGTRVANRVRAMTDAGIAVMGHLGLTPQSLAQLGGYRVQGKTLSAAQRLVDDALALEEAGAFAILLEAMPAETAALV